jgi:hypothetical protein
LTRWQIQRAQRRRRIDTPVSFVRRSRLQQLGDFAGNPSGLVFGEQLGSLIAARGQNVTFLVYPQRQSKKK